MSFKAVTSARDFWPGEMRGVVVDGKRAFLVFLDDTIHAYQDQCVHQRVALSEGRLTGTTLVCSAHEWQYDACTGRGINPEGVQLARYAVEVIGEDVCVDVDAVLQPERRPGL